MIQRLACLLSQCGAGTYTQQLQLSRSHSSRRSFVVPLQIMSSKSGRDFVGVYDGRVGGHTGGDIGRFRSGSNIKRSEQLAEGVGGWDQQYMYIATWGSRGQGPYISIKTVSSGGLAPSLLRRDVPNTT